MRSWLRLSLLAALCGLAPQLPGRAAGAEYTLGIIPQFEQRKLFENWRPIADELERRTGHRIQLITTMGVRQFEAEYMRGTLDFAYMNPFFVAKTARTIGYVPLVRDRVQVSGVLVVRKGGGFASPTELKGRALAFPSPNAVGGCMLVRAELKERFRVEVEPVYVKTVSNVALHVVKGLVDAGGLSEKGFGLLDPAVRDRLRIVHRTRPLVSHAVVAHPRVPVEVRDAVRAALLEFAATGPGRVAFGRVPMKEPMAATIAEYEAVATLGLEAWFEPASTLE
jgi:phosphonate transport system substrate-binding protein